LNAHQGFLVNQNKSNQAMLQAADYAGMAIDITTTTAAHAMSYQLTANYHIAHGHAVGLCLPAVWREMLVHMNLIEDPQQRQELSQIFDEIAYLLGFQEPMQAIDWLNHFIDDLQLLRPQLKNTAELETLVSAVNVQRLKNNPVPLHAEQLREIYAQVLRQGSSTR
jgi:alcohol dehydrogenase class IV